MGTLHCHKVTLLYARASTIKTTQAQYAYIVRHRPNLFRICLFVYVSMFVDGVVVVVIVVGVTVFLLLYLSSFFVSFSSHFSSYFSTLSFSLSLSPCFFLFSLTSYLSISISLYLSLLSSLSLTFYLSISSPLPHSLSISLFISLLSHSTFPFHTIRARIFEFISPKEIYSEFHQNRAKNPHSIEPKAIKITFTQGFRPCVRLICSILYAKSFVWYCGSIHALINRHAIENTLRKIMDSFVVGSHFVWPVYIVLYESAVSVSNRKNERSAQPNRQRDNKTEIAMKDTKRECHILKVLRQASTFEEHQHWDYVDLSINLL